MFYATGIFALYRSLDDDDVALKSMVWVLSLGIKVAGNKLQILLITNMPHIDSVVAESLIFLYEFVTAMLCRVMLFSIPDTTTALILSLANSWLEQSTRIGFFLHYLVGGLSRRDAWTKARFERYTRKGEMRVVDASCDMVVEYISSIVAAFILWRLPQTGLFTFAASGAETTATAGQL